MSLSTRHFNSQKVGVGVRVEAALRMACRPGDEGTSSVGYNHLPDDLREVVDKQHFRRGAVQVSRRLINRGERERERDLRER